MSGGFVHQALVYDGVDGFVAGTVPFVRAGLDAGEHVFTVTTRRNADALRASLGGDAMRVDFRDAEEWYDAPSRTLLAYGRYVEAHGNGRRVRVIGEPIWHGRSDAAVREWARYESILNEAFASSNAWILCPYDTTTLDSRILEFAHATHPEVCDADHTESSTAYVSPRELSAALDADDLDDPPSHAVALPLSAGLGALRTFAREHARAAGLPDERVAGVELAVHEALANAVVHGHGRGVLRAWPLSRELVYEVADEGNGLRDPLAGHLPPDPESFGGFGMWMARQLADLVQVRSRNGGTRVRLHFRRPAHD